MKKQEPSLQINFSTHFRWRHQIYRRMREKGGNWKEWEEHSWIIQEQGHGLDPEMMQFSFSVIAWGFSDVVMAIANYQGTGGCVI